MTDLTGRQLGSYRILHTIGKGGMATVYSATHVETGQVAAVKVLRLDALEDESYVRRFEREARLIGEAKHPNIVGMLDFGQQDNTLYLVMQLLTGGTLARLIRKSSAPLSGMQIARLFDQVAAGLAYAHQLNIIHRDLKPQNVLLDTEQNAYLADFGIAKLINQTATQATTAQGVIGTPAYMAPEQWQNEPVDERTDIYAMGILLFEMLMGNPPFESDTLLGTMNRHLFEPPPSVVHLRPDIPAGMSQVLDRALAKAPEQRYDSVAEMANAVKRSLSGQGASLSAVPKIHLKADAPFDEQELVTGRMFTERLTNVLTPEQLAAANEDENEDEDKPDGTLLLPPAQTPIKQQGPNWGLNGLRAFAYGASWLIVVGLVSGFITLGTWRQISGYTAFDFALLALVGVAALLTIVLPLWVVTRTQQLTGDSRRGFVVGMIGFFLPSAILLIGYTSVEFTVRR